jgi:hypothetical protein
VRDDFRVGLTLELTTVGNELLTERLEILDDPVVDDRDRPNDVRMGIVDCGRAVRRPTRVGDADGPAERLLREFARKIFELSFGSTPNQLAMVNRADAGTVITAIFEALQAIEQALSDLTFADNSNDSAHNPSLDDHVRPGRHRPSIFGL